MTDKQFRHIFDQHFHLIRYALVDEADKFYRWRVFDEGSSHTKFTGKNTIARITALDKVSGGAFVDCGGNDGFIRKVPPRAHIGQLLALRIDRDLRTPTQENKGLRLVSGWQWRTPYVTLKIGQGGGISMGKAKPTESPLLEEALELWQSICQADPKQCQIILSPALRQQKELLPIHFNALAEAYNEANDLWKSQAKPQILSSTPPAVRQYPLWQAILDLPPIKAPLVFANRELFNQAQTILKQFAPNLADDCELYNSTNAKPLFASLASDAKIMQSMSNPHDICDNRNGGRLYIDSCTAATLIDVDMAGSLTSGRHGEDGICAFNLTAAEEVARLIGLLDLGGIILVDFIRMKNPQNRKRLRDRMQFAVRQCRINADILGYSHTGLLEITRRRQHPSLLQNHNHIAAEFALCALSDSLQNPQKHRYSTITITAHEKIIATFKRHYGSIIDSPDMPLAIEFSANKDRHYPTLDFS